LIYEVDFERFFLEKEKTIFVNEPINIEQKIEGITKAFDRFVNP
jgi:hypothetical protein